MEKCNCTEVDECDCMCHKSKDVLHFHWGECCYKCSICGRNIKIKEVKN